MTGMLERDALLAQAPEFFRNFFGGRTPTLAEKMQFVETAVQRMASQNIFENDQYHVEISYALPFIHLNIRRLDGQLCKEWRHFQEIKNALVGSEYEAVELFPAESRLVDTSNEYHLWVCADRNYRFPFGFPQRWVLQDPVVAAFGLASSAESTPVAADRVSRAVSPALHEQTLADAPHGAC